MHRPQRRHPSTSGILQSLAQPIVLCSLLAFLPNVAIAQSAPAQSASAQSAPAQSAPSSRIIPLASCPSQGPTVGDIEQRIGQLQSVVNQQSATDAAALYSELLSSVQRQKNSPQLSLALLESVLQNRFVSPSSISELSTHQLLVEALGELGSSAQVKSQSVAWLNALSQLALQLPSGYSYAKVRSLTQLAQHLIDLDPLDQTQLKAAQSLLQAAEASALNGVKGDIFQTRALAEVARVQAIAQQPQAAQRTLAAATQRYAKIPAQPPVHREGAALALGLVAGSLGDAALSDRWIKEVVKASQRASASTGSDEILQALARTEIRRQNLKAALAIAPRILTPESRIRIQAEVVQLYARLGQRPLGQALFEQTLAQNKDKPELQAMLVRAYAADSPDQALLFVTQGMSADDQLRNFQALTLAFAKAQQPQKAAAVLDTYRARIETSVDSSWRSFELDTWLRTARRAKLLGWVAQNWQKLPGDVRGSYGAFRWDAFVQELARQESIATATTWATTLEAPEGRAIAMTALAEYADRNQQSKPAEALLTSLETQIEPLVKQVQQAGQDVDYANYFRGMAYARLARAHRKAGLGQTARQQAAQRLLKASIAAQPNLGDPTQAQYSDNPYALLMEGEAFDLAFQLAQSIRFPDQRLGWMQEAAVRLVQRNQMQAAETFLKEKISPVNRTQVLLAIATQHQRQGKPQAALPILKQAQAAAQSVTGDESMFDRLGPEGGTVIPMDNDRGSLLIAVAAAYAKQGQLEPARAIVKLLKDAENRTEALRAIEVARCA